MRAKRKEEVIEVKRLSQEAKKRHTLDPSVQQAVLRAVTATLFQKRGGGQSKRNEQQSVSHQLCRTSNSILAHRSE